MLIETKSQIRRWGWRETEIDRARERERETESVSERVEGVGLILN